MEEKEKNVVSEGKSSKDTPFWLMMINLCFALSAIALFALLRIIVCFAGLDGALIGVFMLLIYGAAIAGVVWNLIKAKGPSFEFIFSSATLGILFIASFI